MRQKAAAPKSKSVSAADEKSIDIRIRTGKPADALEAASEAIGFPRRDAHALGLERGDVVYCVLVDVAPWFARASHAGIVGDAEQLARRERG